MKRPPCQCHKIAPKFLAPSLLALGLLTSAQLFAGPAFNWQTVVNNGDAIPALVPSRNFNSYNQPSINDAGVVVFRARAKGGDGHGIFARDMSVPAAPITMLAIRDGAVPAPNNVINPGPATFTEFPSFPRIDAKSGTVAFRAQSKPSWITYAADGITEITRSGTSGLYATPGAGTPVGGPLSTGIRNTEPSAFPQFLVPNQSVATKFDQFPGAPSPDGNIVTFKGNWTDSSGASQTGVYFRDMVAGGGTLPVVEVARRGMAIPTNAVPGGGFAVFDSTSPPSAAAGKMVFTGLDNEAAPTAGGIFMAPLTTTPALTTVAGFQTVAPKNGTETLKAFGEGLSFDGRYVGFWGGWGMDTFARQVKCASDGNAALIAACYAQDNNGTANDGIYTFDILKNQGIFLADTELDKLFLVTQTGSLYDDFLFWNFSGKPPGEEGEDDAEEPRWRSSAFLAIDGNDVVFKALKGDVSGLYGALDVSDLFADSDLFTIVTTGMNGGLLDPAAAGMDIISLGIERDGFRDGRLAITASMEGIDPSDPTKTVGWAGIYVASVPEPGTLALLALGALAIPFARGRRAVA